MVEELKLNTHRMKSPSSERMLIRPLPDVGMLTPEAIPVELIVVVPSLEVANALPVVVPTNADPPEAEYIQVPRYSLSSICAVMLPFDPAVLPV